MPMEKEKKETNYPVVFPCYYGFSHLSACDSLFKKIYTNKTHTINMGKYTKRNLNAAILQSSLWAMPFSLNCT